MKWGPRPLYINTGNANNNKKLSISTVQSFVLRGYSKRIHADTGIHTLYKRMHTIHSQTVQEQCESRGGRPGLSVLTSLLVSVDVKIY